MKKRLVLFVVALLLAGGADASPARTHWPAQNDCAKATKAKCVKDGEKGWRAAAPAAKTKAEAKVDKPDNQAAVGAEAKAEVAAAPVVTAIARDVKPQEAVPPVASPAVVPPVAAKEEAGFFSKLFGGKKESVPAATKPSADTVDNKEVAPEEETSVQSSPPPQPERPPVDPEAVLRGKVWDTEAACKKEALRGKCSSIDCATHVGGACTGYTSMIWIYR